MKNLFSHYVPIGAMLFSLSLIPNEYLPRMDAFLYAMNYAQTDTGAATEDSIPSASLSADSEATDTDEVQEDASLNTGSSEAVRDEAEDYVQFAIAQVSDYVNVRSIPGTDGDIVGRLVNGAVAEVQSVAGENGDWFQIVSGNVTGYIKSKYFISGEEAAAVLDKHINTYATILADHLNVRKEASTDADKNGYLEASEQVLVLEDLGEWLHIQYTDSINGYISKEYAQLSESYIYAQSNEERKAQKELWKTRRNRVQPVTNQYIIPEDTDITFPATTYTSNEELRKAIVENAMQYLGNKYVHGGNSLKNGTDCSGFTMLLFAEYGYSISRTPAGQLEKAGRSIDYSEIQPGDIICYTNNGSTCTHVALYIGDGQIIHAANSRKGVVIYNADYDTIMGIKNVID